MERTKILYGTDRLDQLIGTQNAPRSQLVSFFNFFNVVQYVGLKFSCQWLNTIVVEPLKKKEGSCVKEL